MKRFAAFAATIGWMGLVLELYLTMGSSRAMGLSVLGGVVRYLSFFTILTNILIAAALTHALRRSRSGLTGPLLQPSWLTGLAASGVLVGIASSLAPRDLWDPKGLQLVADVVTHRLMPVLYLVYWWRAVPKEDLRWAHVTAWTLYPIAYFLLAMFRGEVSGLYPYRFMDPDKIGHVRVLENALGVLVFFAAISLLLVAAGRLQARRRFAASDPTGKGTGRTA